MLESLLTHQKEYYEKLKEAMKQQSFFCITGKAGIGKSYIIDTLCKDKYYEGYTILLFKGDKINQFRPYYPFNRLFGYESSLYQYQNLSVEAVKEIPKVGTSISLLLDNILNKDIFNYKNNFPYLNNEEITILSKLKYLTNHKKTIMVFDDFQYWDNESILLISTILNSIYDFEFMKKNQCIFVFTPSYKNNTQNFFIEHHISEINFEQLTFEQFQKDRHYLGYNNNLDLKRLQFIYKLGDGNILLYKEIAKELPMDNYIFQNKYYSGIQYLNVLLEKRMTELGATGKQIMYILEFGSIIGLSFSCYELEYVTHLKEGEFIRIIEQAKKWDLIEDDEKKFYCKFVHNIILEIFKHRTENNIYHYYDKLENSLKKIKPGSYLRRARYCILMRELNKAINLYLLELFQELRNNNSVFKDVEQEALGLMDEELLFYYTYMRDAYNLYLNKEYSQALFKLEKIPSSYNRLLLAEKDLIKSRCLSKSLCSINRKEAIDILERYYENEIICQESDLWERLMTSLITAYYHGGRKKDAQNLEEEVLSNLSERSTFDSTAKFRLHILYRNSNSIHESEFAEMFIKKAVNYFGRITDLGIPYNILEYYKALLNYSSTLCKNGCFDESFLQTQIAINLQNDFSDILFPRKQIMYNNFAITGFLSGKLNLNQSIQIMQKICKKIPNIAERLFYISNLCIFLILNNDLLGAESYLNKEKKKFDIDNDLEGSYKYKIYLLYTLIEYLKGNYKKAIMYLNVGYKSIHCLTDYSYINQKYKLLFDILESKERIEDPYYLDLCLLEKMPNYQNSVWKFIGRVFPYSILSNWDI